jgi:CubicO group peptidase (beta-lactamase class C family)
MSPSVRRVAFVRLGLAALCCGLVVGAAPAPRAPSRFARDLDAWVRPMVEAGHLSGSLLVSRGGRVLLERSWGDANRELRAPVTPETRFCVASITKPMTVMIAIQLIEEGRLRMGDSLARWIPDFPSGDRMTIEHLLRHRAGIPHRVTEDNDEVAPHTAADMVEFARRKALLFAPGESSVYSSGGFAVLARVLELAGGRDYGTLLEERICRPLGMTHTLHADARQLVPHRAASYLHGLRGIENAPLKDNSFLVGGGSVISTARDIHTLLQAVVSGRMGEGARQSWLRGGRLNWNGSTNGFRAFAIYDSATAVAMVYTGNVHTGAADLLRAAIPRLLAGESVAPARVPDPERDRVALGEAALRGYQGIYDLSNGVRLEVRARDGGLVANDWTLVPVANDRFLSLRDYGDVRVVRDSTGGIVRLDWESGGTMLAAPRVGDLP